MKITIMDKRCVNSLWTADWLAKKGQESCQCIVECKVKVIINGYAYYVTQAEYKKFKKMK